MLIALAFAHFSSKLIIPVKKTLHNVGHIDAKLIDFSEICQKKSSEIAVFYWLFLGEVSSQNFPWNRPIFLRICPWKSFEIWLFSAKIPRNRPIFLRILTFLLPKSREIGRFLCEFWLFSHEIGQFFCQFSLLSRENPAKIPRNRPIFPEFAPENPAKILLYLREISEALYIAFVEYFLIPDDAVDQNSFIRFYLFLN